MASQIDVNNYMDWCIAQIFYSNAEYGQHPILAGAKAGFQMALGALRYGLGHVRDIKERDRAVFRSPRGRRRLRVLHPAFGSMIENAAWRQAFLERFRTYATTSFSSEHLVSESTGLTATIAGRSSGIRPNTPVDAQL